MDNKIYVVGIGPGAYEQMTMRAAEALRRCDVIVGYTVYVELVKEHFANKRFLTTPMKKEIERCRLAFEEANKGYTVAMICSGDAGVYGMSGLMLEIGQEYPHVKVEVIPGVTAANGGAAVLGAPLIHDFAVISLSDLLTPWEKGLSAALDCSGALDADKIEAAVCAAFQTYLHFNGTVPGKSPFRLHFSDKWVPLLTKLLPTELVRTDELTLGRCAAAGENGVVRASNALRSRLRSNEREGEDRTYIERCFGRSIYSPRQLALIEQRCCSGSHLGCHLWFTHGEHPPGQAMSADTQRLFEQAAQQAKRNRAAYDCESELHQSALVRLTEQIQNCMLIHQQPEDLLARKGRLDGTRVWRTPVLQDGRVFLRKDEESRAGFTVDLMLDASASRLRCQESIAIEGYILAKSLAACGIPVRVTSFCSLRGYTVLHILKDFGDKNGERRVFDYFAAGWNRDGLALRGMGELIKSAPEEKHLLLLLTDASPNDSHKILPSGKVPLSREYDGQSGIDDTAAEVRSLRAKGVRVAALFMGENSSVPAANAIYSRDLVRIRRIDQLASAAGRLIQDEIRELSL